MYTNDDDLLLDSEAVLVREIQALSAEVEEAFEMGVDVAPMVRDLLRWQ